MLKNIIFDYDGVLRHINDISLYEYLKPLFPNRDLKRYKNRYLREYVDSPLIKHSFETFDLGLCNLKHLVTNASIILDEDIEVVTAIFVAAIDPDNNLPILETINFTKELFKAGYNLYVFSNLNKSERRVAPKALDFSIFKDALFSCDVGLMKPNLDYYVYAIKKWHIKPEESLFIDDNEKNLKNFYLMNGNVFLFDRYNVKKSLKELKDYIAKLSIH